MLAKELTQHLRSGRPTRRNIHHSVSGQWRSQISDAVSMGVLRPARRGSRGVWKHRRSHRDRELDECRRQAQLWRDVGGEFVVAAAEVLHERMAGGDPGG